MKVFTSNDFTGYYPVGTAAVVVAEDREDARELLRQALANEGLPCDKPFTLQEVCLAHPQAEPMALVLCNGNY
jgi:hypothetical protein